MEKQKIISCGKVPLNSDNLHEMIPPSDTLDFMS